MNRNVYPLLDVFLNLTRRHVNVGPRDYLDIIHALTTADVVSTRKELIWLMQAMWGTDLDDQQCIAADVAAVLPLEITPDRLQSLVNKTEHKRD